MGAIMAASKSSWGVLATPKEGMVLLSSQNRGGRTGLLKPVLRIPQQRGRLKWARIWVHCETGGMG